MDGDLFAAVRGVCACETGSLRGDSAALPMAWLWVEMRLNKASRKLARPDLGPPTYRLLG